MWSAVAYTSITDGYIYNFGIDTSLALTIPFAVYFMPGALVTSIIAKALNRKSKWALINIIAACALFVTMLVISLFLPSWGRSINASGSSRDGGISGDWNRDVEELLEEYDFDVTDMDEDYSHLSGDTYEIRIFVSSEASDSDIDEINDFLRDLIELEQKTKYHHMVVRIYPCYFEPGDNSSFVYTKRFRLKEDTSPSDIYIEDSLYDGLKNARRVPGHVPEELENGNLLIVVR